MAVIIKSGGLKPRAEQETFPGTLRRNIIGRGTEALSSVGGFPGNIEQLGRSLVGSASPTIFPTSEQVKRGIIEESRLPEEYFQPQGAIETAASKFAQSAPLSALTAGVPGLIASGVGSLAGTAAQQFGAPEGVQDLVQLGTELGTGLATGKIPTIRSAQKEAYKATKGSVSAGTKSTAKPIVEAIRTTSKELGTEVGEKTHKNIMHILGKLEHNIDRGKINPVIAMDLRKKLYQTGKKLSAYDRTHYIDPLTKGINNFFVEYGVENPDFFSKLTKADKLTELRNMGNYLADNLPKLKISSIPGVGLAAEKIAQATIKNIDRLTRGVYKNPEARKYYFGAVSSLAHQNPALFVNNMINLAGVEPEIAYTPESKGGIKIKQGGLISQ